MRKILIPFFCCCICLGALAQSDDAGPKWLKVDYRQFTLNYAVEDSSEAASMASMVSEGMASVTQYFGHSYKHPFNLYVFPSRHALDLQWQHDYGDTSFRSECWMVASGVGDYLQVLSPRVWEAEACEHDALDRPALQKLITHELVHVYHGQQNPIRDFTGLDSLAWFIEGVATFVSGQVDEMRLKQVKDVIASGKEPKELKYFWMGKAKYGLAGSLVSYMDYKYGKKTIFKLLRQTDQRIMLQMLGTTESELIAGWKAGIQ